MKVNSKGSFPLRERGLKPDNPKDKRAGLRVVPLAGTWIETGSYSRCRTRQTRVVPLAGTWIETASPLWKCPGLRSFPLRERGLKQQYVRDAVRAENVVPLAGTWIETRTPE